MACVAVQSALSLLWSLGCADNLKTLQLEDLLHSLGVELLDTEPEADGDEGSPCNADSMGAAPDSSSHTASAIACRRADATDKLYEPDLQFLDENSSDAISTENPEHREAEVGDTFGTDSAVGCDSALPDAAAHSAAGHVHIPYPFTFPATEALASPDSDSLHPGFALTSSAAAGSPPALLQAHAAALGQSSSVTDMPQRPSNPDSICSAPEDQQVVTGDCDPTTTGQDSKQPCSKHSKVKTGALRLDLACLENCSPGHSNGSQRKAENEPLSPASPPISPCSPDSRNPGTLASSVAAQLPEICCSPALAPAQRSVARIPQAADAPQQASTASCPLAQAHLTSQQPACAAACLKVSSPRSFDIA